MTKETEKKTPYETDDINIRNQVEQQGFHCVCSKIKNGKEVWGFAESKEDIQAGKPGSFLVKMPSADEIAEKETQAKKKKK